MLEVFYETQTKIVTAWRSEGRQGVRPIREGETKVMLDILPPSNEGATVRDYLYGEATMTLKLRPDFAYEVPSTRDFAAEIDEIKARVETLENQ